MQALHLDDKMPMGVHFGDDDDQFCSNMSSLVVRRASEVQHEHFASYMAEVWGATLSRKEFAALAKKCREEPWMKMRKSYVLVRRDCLDTTDFRAACTVKEVNLLVVEAGGSTVHKATAAQVDNVLVPPKYRGRGYATEMLKQLATVLEAHISDSQVIAAYGFSEAGQALYERAGGRNVPSTEMTVAADASPIPFGDCFDDLELLGPAKLTEYLDDDIADLKRVLACSDKSSTRFVVEPSEDMYAYMVWRQAEHFAPIRGWDRLPKIFGARISAKSFCYWIHSLNQKIIYIQRFVAVNKDEAKRLLECACFEAQWWSCHKVIAWDIDEKLAEALGIQVYPRRDDFLMLLSADENAKMIPMGQYSLVTISY